MFKYGVLLNKRELQALDFIEKNSDVIIEDVAIYWTKEGKQHIFNPAFSRLKELGIVIETSKTKLTTNGAPAKIYIINPEIKEDITMTNNYVCAFNNKSSSVKILSHAEIVNIFLNHSNVNNRDVRESAKLKEMRKSFSEQAKLDPQGILRLHYSSIVFGENGILLDGHHRIQALAQSDVKAVEITVVLGVPSENIAYMDIGKKRTGKDTMVMALKEESVKLNSAEDTLMMNVVNHVLGNADNQNYLRFTGVASTNEEVREWVLNNKEEVQDFLSFVKDLCSSLEFKKIIHKHGYKRAVAAFLFDAWKKDADFAKDFITAVWGRNTDGVFEGCASDSIKQLFEKLTTTSDGKKTDRPQAGAEVRVYTALSVAFNGLKEKPSKFKNIKPGDKRLVPTVFNEKTQDNIPAVVRV